MQGNTKRSEVSHLNKNINLLCPEIDVREESKEKVKSILDKLKINYANVVPPGKEILTLTLIRGEDIIPEKHLVKSKVTCCNYITLLPQFQRMFLFSCTRAFTTDFTNLVTFFKIKTNLEFLLMCFHQKKERAPKEIQIIVRLFLVMAMYCQASSSQFCSITQPPPLLASYMQ